MNKCAKVRYDRVWFSAIPAEFIYEIQNWQFFKLNEIKISHPFTNIWRDRWLLSVRIVSNVRYKCYFVETIRDISTWKQGLIGVDIYHRKIDKVLDAARFGWRMTEKGWDARVDSDLSVFSVLRGRNSSFFPHDL